MSHFDAVDDPFDFEVSRAVLQEQLLKTVYMRIGVPVDLLAYTKQFDILFAQYVAESGETDLSKADLYRRLLTMRKSGRLPRLIRSTEDTEKIEEPG